MICYFLNITNINPQNNGQVSQRLERLPTMPKITVRDPPITNHWKPAYCPLSSKWGHNRGKELDTLPHNADGQGQLSSLTGIAQHTDHIWDIHNPDNFLCLTSSSRLCIVDSLGLSMIVRSIPICQESYFKPGLWPNHIQEAVRLRWFINVKYVFSNKSLSIND